VALVGQWQRDTEYMRFPRAYAHALTLAGLSPRDITVVTPFQVDAGDLDDEIEIHAELDERDSSVLDHVGALVIPGGGDIDPEWYGKPRHARTRNVSHTRDGFELNLLGEALDRDMPVLAICHGMQLLNVHLGGTLDQHLQDVAERLDHDRDRPRAEPAHHLRLEPGSLVEKILETSETQVNSHHHQGLDQVAPALQEVGWAEDGVLEAVVSTQHSWVVGVQWHPEVMAPVDHRQLRIFDSLAAAAGADAAELRRPAARTA
jgi:putative glutamine amidotransferase